jgi:hypothetical protein
MENLDIHITEMPSDKEKVDTESPPIVTTPPHPIEVKHLKAIALKIFIILAFIIIVCGILLGFKKELNIPLIWACIVAGILGSTSSALISALQRKANGWEMEDGKKYPIDPKKAPADDKRDMFSQRMATFFLYRPAFGIIGGLLSYYGAQSSYFIGSGGDKESKFIFFALLSGLFVKSLIEKLKDLFDNLIGNK